MADQEPDTSQVLLYQTEDRRTRIEVRLEGATVWLTQGQLAELFQTTPQNITQHLRAIYAEGELDAAATCKEDLQVRQEGGRNVRRALKHYNLDVVVSVGYRVRSHGGTQFRQWATERLREYIVKGFSLDDERLKQSSAATYFDELLERIRDIRSSERMFYRKVLDIYATSIDYDPRTETSQEFFAAAPEQDALGRSRPHRRRGDRRARRRGQGQHGTYELDRQPHYAQGGDRR